MQTKFVRGPNGAVIPEEYLKETAVHNAEVEMMVALRDELKDFDRDLKQIDPDLELVWAPESANCPGLVPGRYHVLRRNPPPAPPLLLALEHDDGSFREPGSWMFDWLRKQDLWNDRAQADRRKAEEELERRRDKRRAEEREELIWDIDERLRVANNPSVLFGGVPWKKAA